MRILVIEDDEKIASFLSNGLKEAGFTVDLAHDGHKGLSLLLSTDYEAAVVDIMLPGMDGLAVIETVRKRGIDTPVLILSAKRTVDDRIKGLQQGGDDYMIKPFSFAELLARIQALIRRDSRAVENHILSAADLKMDLLARKVSRENRQVDLSAKEFSLLEYLLRNQGRIVSKTAVLENVYDYSFDPQTNVVDVLVCRLRSKVDKDFKNKLIHTVRGMGYVLRQE
jgi:two-component system, OmpR family, response regulator